MIRRAAALRRRRRNSRSPALSSSYPVRFDQVVWATNNTRDGGAETQVMLRSGETTWVPTEHIVDTGY